MVIATAVPPPNWLKSAVTAPIVSGLLSPLPELSHTAVTVSPMRSVLLAPVAVPRPAMLPSVSTGAMLSTVALVVSAAVVVPLLSVALTETLRLVASTLPDVTTYFAVHTPLASLLAATAVPPPNWLKFTVTLLTLSVLLSPSTLLFQVTVTVSPIL